MAGEQQATSLLFAYLLVAARIVSATSVIPMVVRGVGALWLVGLGLLLTLAFTPGLTSSMPETATSWPLSLGQECLVGMCMGFAIAVCLSAMQWAANLVGGLESADSPPGPSALAGHSWRTLTLGVACIGFLHVHGDHLVLREVLHSYREFPLGTGCVSIDGVRSVTTVLSRSMMMAISLTAPMASGLIFARLLVSVLSRALPSIWIPSLQSFGTVLSAVVCAAVILMSASWLPEQLAMWWGDGECARLFPELCRNTLRLGE